MSVDKRSNGKWLARWREYPGGPQKSKQFDRKIDAERHVAEQIVALNRGTYVDPTAGKVTLQKYGTAWLERMQQTWRPATYSVVEGSLRGHVWPTLGGRPLTSIKRADVEAWAAGLDLKPSTVATVRQHLGQVLTAAVDDGLLPRNPAAGARMPRPEDRRAQPVDGDTLDRLAGAAPAWFGVAIPLALGIGLRQGEACGLTVDRVDFLRRTVRVDRQLVTPTSGAPALKPPKTSSSYRTIPLPTFVGDALAAHLAEHGAGVHGLVLHQPDGAPIARNRFGRLWRAMKPGTVRYHDLRHTFASTLLSNGVSIKAVSDWLGHASPMVTLSTYAHLMPVDEDRARSVLDAAFAAAEDQVRTEATA